MHGAAERLSVQVFVVFNLVDQPEPIPFPGLPGFFDHLINGVIAYFGPQILLKNVRHSSLEGVTAGALRPTVRFMIASWADVSGYPVTVMHRRNGFYYVTGKTLDIDTVF